MIQIDQFDDVDEINGGIGTNLTVDGGGSFNNGYSTAEAAYTNNLVLDGTITIPYGPTVQAFSWPDTGSGSGTAISFVSIMNSLSVTQSFNVNGVLTGEFQNDSLGLPTGTLHASAAIYVYDTTSFNAAMNAHGTNFGQWLLSGNASITNGQLGFSSFSSYGIGLQWDQPFTNSGPTSLITVRPGQGFTVLFYASTSGEGEMLGDTIGSGTVWVNLQAATNCFTDTNGNAITGLTVYSPPPAQTPVTFTTLYQLGSGGAAWPFAGLILSSNTLYGTTTQGGFFGGGTVFALHTDGTGFSILSGFSPVLGSFPFQTNSDGFNPAAGLTLSGNTLYGTAQLGGTNGYGTIYALNTNGNFKVLYEFTAPIAGKGTNSDGYHPAAGLTLSGNTLYGTAEFGGSSGGGTVFAINTNGTGFTVLNSSVDMPLAGLIVSGPFLYGTVSRGGYGGDIFGDGAVISINSSFQGNNISYLHVFSGYDGSTPAAGLILSSNTLYGTTEGFGSYVSGTPSQGAVFRVNTDGSGFTNLYSFSMALSGQLYNVNGIEVGPYTNSDGFGPQSGLVLSGNTLYGTTVTGGTNGTGTVFSVNTDGTDFSILHTFGGVTNTYNDGVGVNSDGANPAAGLTLSGNTLYGTAAFGGLYGNGTVFKIVIPVPLTCQNIGGQIVLSWNDPTFVLQSATSLSGPYSSVPGATSPYTVGMFNKGGRIPQQYFRLLVSQ